MQNKEWSARGFALSKQSTNVIDIESTYDSVTGKRSNMVIEKLGALEELSRVHEDPITWDRELAKMMMLEEYEVRKLFPCSYRTIS